MTLTDGLVSVEGVEVAPFTPPAASADEDGAGCGLHPHTPPGTKVGLVGVPLRRGRLLLTPDNCTVLGECSRLRRGFAVWTNSFMILC